MDNRIGVFIYDKSDLKLKDLETIIITLNHSYLNVNASFDMYKHHLMKDANAVMNDLTDCMNNETFSLVKLQQMHTTNYRNIDPVAKAPCVFDKWKFKQAFSQFISQILSVYTKTLYEVYPNWNTDLDCFALKKYSEFGYTPPVKYFRAGVSPDEPALEFSPIGYDDEGKLVAEKNMCKWSFLFIERDCSCSFRIGKLVYSERLYKEILNTIGMDNANKNFAGNAELTPHQFMDSLIKVTGSGESMWNKGHLKGYAIYV